ncbi:hypothetical protein BDA96_06G057500 [Sorghum bicolor]|uniref:Uncharacterized protein n=2 Tax=Sorghum bicolor TaxID=4558 RepID=A0A921QPF0_SORBI|nr:hypothetical protein BDA96_06G056800 [Sorghum bicolor]KAG0525449.1 hypothetical protein BDA96_06G057500 [Sorghum bicolor]OQU81390.1 hypothetical protein SORBI_3006G050550 [Sorghum bicolor]
MPRVDGTDEEDDPGVTAQQIKAIFSRLTTHKSRTHDVVALKPNKADVGSASLGQGVLYRLKVHLCHLMLLGT